MKEERFYLILGQLDDDLIEEAEHENLRHDHNTASLFLRLGLIAALALLIGAASLGTAFTVNAEFRQAVIEFFHLQQKESVPKGDIEPPLNSSEETSDFDSIRLYQSNTIGDIFAVQYLQSDAYIQAMDDIFYYTNGNGKQEFYQATENGFEPVAVHSIRKDVSLHGFTGHIDYSYCLLDDQITLIENNRSRTEISENTEIMFALEGTSLQSLRLVLYKNPQQGEWSYPVKYDPVTNEIDDYLQEILIEGTALSDQKILKNWSYVDENTLLVCTGQDGDLYKIDLRTDTSVNISRLFDIPPYSGIKVLDHQLFILTDRSLETFDYISYHLDTGEKNIVYENISYWNEDSGEEEYKVAFTGGRYDLVEKDGLIYLADELLRTMTVIDGMTAGLASGPLINKSGDKILVSSFGEACIEQIGVIDTKARTFYLLDRTNSNSHEYSIYWNDNEHIALAAANDDFTKSYVYLYSLKPHD